MMREGRWAAAPADRYPVTEYERGLIHGQIDVLEVLASAPPDDVQDLIQALLKNWRARAAERGIA